MADRACTVQADAEVGLGDGSGIEHARLAIAPVGKANGARRGEMLIFFGELRGDHLEAERRDERHAGALLLGEVVGQSRMKDVLITIDDDDPIGDAPGFLPAMIFDSDFRQFERVGFGSNEAAHLDLSVRRQDVPGAVGRVLVVDDDALCDRFVMSEEIVDDTALVPADRVNVHAHHKKLLPTF